MTSKHGVHAKPQTAFRLPEGLLAWLKDQAGREGGEVTMTAIVERALERERERCEGITTSATPDRRVSPPPKRPRTTGVAPSATFRPPAQSPDCPHPKARINKGLCGACGTHVGLSRT